MNQLTAVGIPKEAKNFKVMSVDPNIGMDAGLHYELPDRNVLQQLPDANYSILGKLSELTDEQCKPYVNSEDFEAEKYLRNEPTSPIYIYKSYTEKDWLISKLKSEGKLCKWRVQEPDPHHFSNFSDWSERFQKAYREYNSLPDDLLILIHK